MALRIHDMEQQIFGTQQVVDFHVDGDSSYPPGGYELPITLEAMGLGRIALVIVTPTAAAEGYVWDYVNKKLIFTNGAGAESTGASDQSTRINIHVRAYGKR